MLSMAVRICAFSFRNRLRSSTPMMLIAICATTAETMTLMMIGGAPRRAAVSLASRPVSATRLAEKATSPTKASTGQPFL